MRVGVVGGGVVGLATAWYLKKGGADPVVVDAGAVGDACSRGNCGWVCPSLSAPLPVPGLTTLRSILWMLRPDSPLYIRPTAFLALRSWLRRFRSHCTKADYQHGILALAALNGETAARFAELAAGGVDFESGRSGLLFAFRDPAKTAAARREVGVVAAAGVASYEVLNRTGLYEQEPMLRQGFTGGLLVDSDFHVRPETLTAGLARSLRTDGVRIHEGVAVAGFETEGRKVRAMITTKGTMEVDAAVLAAGAETGHLAGMLGARIPLTAGKGYSVTIEQPRNQLRQPLYLGEAKIGLTPYRGALRIAGTMELSGVNRRLDPRRIQPIRRAVLRDVVIPEAKDGGTPWVGMRPMVPDTLPVVGRLPASANAYVNTGHQMLGVTLSPSTGHALARMLLGETPNTDMAPFSPSRF